MPDLLVIHSSEVSIFFDKSSLETIFVGKYDPTPVNNIEFEMCNLHKNYFKESILTLLNFSLRSEMNLYSTISAATLIAFAKPNASVPP